MRYKEITAFQNHLIKSAPDHFSSAYFLLIPQEDERRYFIDRLTSKFLHFYPLSEVKKGELFLSTMLKEISSYSLFARELVFLIYNIDAANEEMLEHLKTSIAQGNSEVLFILGGAKKEPMTSLYTSLKKETVMLDLLEEKPWHRKERIISYLIATAHKAGKIIEPQLLEEMISKCGLNFSQLRTTLEQLICYNKSDDVITLAKALPLLPEDPKMRLWDLAEKLIWETSEVPIHQIIVEDWVPLLGAMRYQLQIGWKIVNFLRRNKEISPAIFPKIKTQRLHMLVAKTREWGEEFFRQSLLYIFETEVAAKTSIDPLKALTLCMFHLQLLKERYASSHP